MRKFNIIRYLKRWWPLIALMSILAGAFFMRYASNNLNQYAKKANETGSIYLEDIQDLQKRFDLIWEELKGIHTRLASIE